MAQGGAAPGTDSRNAGMEERMKRMMIIMMALLIAASGSVVFAQAAAGSGPGSSLDKSGSIREQSDLYPARVDVVRVYSHSQGYRVVYRKGSSDIAELYIPSAWFVPGGKAILIKSRGPQYPYMVVYYKSDGSFSHVKLFTLQNMKDPSWGTIEGDPGDHFKVDTIKLEF